MDENDLKETIDDVIEAKTEELLEDIDWVAQLIEEMLAEKKSEIIEKEIEKRLRYISIDQPDSETSYGA